MAWIDCPFIAPDERGNHVIRGTNIWPEDIVMLQENGSKWLAHTFAIPLQTVRSYLTIPSCSTWRDCS